MARKTLGTTGKIRFDVTKEHRIAGNGATYVVKNYKNAIEHPEFQQAIEMGNALGYHGHPRRKVLKDGKITYEHVLFPHEDEAKPTHMCISASMDGNYCTHEQAFFDLSPKTNTPFSMWQAESGGFSSRASIVPGSGGYGGRFFPTKLARMGGMDYVHDRSYRYNGPQGVIASESVVKPLELEYLMDDLHIEKVAAHFICNGGTCPKPGEIALEEAMFLQRMEYELALEEVYKQEIEAAFKKGFEENLENEKKDFHNKIEEFQETFKEDKENELIAAEKIAIECVQRMPRKPKLDKEFFKIIAPALIKNGTDEAAIESVFYDIINPFTGYTKPDFIEPKEEFVNVGASQKERIVFHSPNDKYLTPQ